MELWNVIKKENGDFEDQVLREIQDLECNLRFVKYQMFMVY